MSWKRSARARDDGLAVVFRSRSRPAVIRSVSALISREPVKEGSMAHAPGRGRAGGAGCR